MRAKILLKSDIAEKMNNHFCSLGSKLASSNSNYHPDPLIRAGGLQKQFFRPFRPQFDYCDAV